jgi:hypothetical protein
MGPQGKRSVVGKELGEGRVEIEGIWEEGERKTEKVGKDIMGEILVEEKKTKQREAGLKRTQRIT